ncbi:hypothetical protein BJ508DRAFT_332464 [Ascobolus immersus RN42]|uniref:Uncharacterized protein n=1 Tax=Ascobolus immersus RN42 TaxID=1160509 RepID=A0A3N4HMP5_ASCIM|nr:hypothetical protein BJ508DRAFT_332464 [Ascobolus immersus RN42]
MAKKTNDPKPTSTTEKMPATERLDGKVGRKKTSSRQTSREKATKKKLDNKDEATDHQMHKKKHKRHHRKDPGPSPELNATDKGERPLKKQKHESRGTKSASSSSKRSRKSTPKPTKPTNTPQTPLTPTRDAPKKAHLPPQPLSPKQHYDALQIGHIYTLPLAIPTKNESTTYTMHPCLIIAKSDEAKEVIAFSIASFTDGQTPSQFFSTTSPRRAYAYVPVGSAPVDFAWTMDIPVSGWEEGGYIFTGSKVHVAFSEVGHGKRGYEEIRELGVAGEKLVEYVWEMHRLYEDFLVGVEGGRFDEGKFGEAAGRIAKKYKAVFQHSKDDREESSETSRPKTGESSSNNRTYPDHKTVITSGPSQLYQNTDTDTQQQASFTTDAKSFKEEYKRRLAWDGQPPRLETAVYHMNSPAVQDVEMADPWVVDQMLRQMNNRQIARGLGYRGA